ncbi:MAG: ribonuclease HII [Clostridia bacterium]|nr:ribonuclease HII [Clostridia bacterium]
MLDYSFDDQFKIDGVKYVCGTDEAGRGPLAGPVVAAACILPDGAVIEGLDDSKKLSEKKREKLFSEICEKALSYSIALSTPEEIDTINILEASLRAMRRSIEGLSVEPDIVLVDGNINRGFKQKAVAVVGGDALSQSIAAASILAKVTRDRLCEELDEKYPLYNFKKHKGYPTKAHKLAVYEYGPCPEHRRSFLSFLERDREKLEGWLAEKREKEENGL